MSGRVYFLGAAVLLVCASSAWSVKCRWTDRGADHLWDDPGNWEDGIVPGSGDYWLSTPYYARRTDWSLYKMVIQDGIDAVCGQAKNMNQLLLTITGGSLTVENEWKLGQDNGVGVEIEMSGGEVDVGGYMDLGGWSGAHSVGTLNISDGFFSVAGPLKMGTWDTTESHLNISGGVVSAGSLAIGPGPSSINISGGRLTLANNVTSQIAWHAGRGTITAFGGDGEIVYDYDVTTPGRTTVMAVPEPSGVLYLIAGWFVARRRRQHRRAIDGR